MEDERLPMAQILSYGLPSFATAMIMISVAIYLPNFYTDEVGVTAGMLSWVFLAGRVWDAVTDPLMGHLSDGTRTRWGRRRPYFVIAALPLWLVFYLIWSPDPSHSTQTSFVLLLVYYLVLYTFWTVFNVPYVSLGMELTPAYHERTRLFAGRQGFMILGTLVGMLAPTAFDRLWGGKASGYSVMAIVFGGLCATLILVTFWRVRERPELSVGRTYPFFTGLRVTLRNRAFVVLLLVYLFNFVGGSFIAPLTLYMAKYVIKAEWVVPFVMVAYMLGTLLSIPLWLRLSRLYGKKKAWTIALVVGTIGYALTYAYDEGTWLLWIVLAVVVGSASGCGMTMGPAISADVIDSDELETGRRREGAFIGVWSFLDKAAVGLAVFIGLQGLEQIGYQPNVEQTEQVKFGLKFLYCILPAVFHLIGVLIFQKFPITEEVHAGIRAQLEARRAANQEAGSG